MKKTGIIKILSLVLGGIITVGAIGGSIYLYSASRRLQSIQLLPDFEETTLDVEEPYYFSVITTPSEAKINNIKCVVDDPNSTFEICENGKILLVTGKSENTFSLYVECDDIKSETLSYEIIDLKAHKQKENADSAESAMELREGESNDSNMTDNSDLPKELKPEKMYVIAAGDNVNIRSDSSTNGDVLGKARRGDKFEKVEEIDDWTHILYNDKDAFIKTEFLDTISEEEYYRESLIDKQEQASNDLPDNTSIITGAVNDMSAEIAEKNDAKEDASLSSTSQVVSKTFSCKISDFQYFPYTYPGLEGGYYQKNEIYELKVGDTLNYAVGITNDTGKLFTQTGGTILSNSAPTEANLVGLSENLGLINPGSTQIVLQGSIKIDEVCQKLIMLGIQETGNPLELQGPFGPTYRYEITVKWIK